jgi:hypothetical protein
MPSGCRAWRIGTQIGFAIGGFAPAVAAAFQGEGPNAWVLVALLNLAIRVVASIAAWTARDPTLRCTAQGESASNFDPTPIRR